jgi:hypothetical protein
MTQPTCTTGGAPLQCTCSTGHWQCPETGVLCAVDADVACPAATSINQGGACSSLPSMQCPADIPFQGCNGTTTTETVNCSCSSGAWACELPPGPLCAVDAQACPKPSATYVGYACPTAGLTCPGDPQPCSSTTIYDTLQCTGGVWELLASSYCDVYDGGYFDVTPFDGFGLDAGFADASAD